jgi:hypothetical protein
MSVVLAMLGGFYHFGESGGKASLRRLFFSPFLSYRACDNGAFRRAYAAC